MNRNSVYIIFIALATLFLSWSCSVKKNTGLSRAYHNVTAKYNVLFNGSESFNKALEKIESDFKDDYSEILPVFKYGNKDAVSLASSDMDRTIKKCSKLISLHSITVKPKVRDNKNLTPDQRAFFSKKEYNLFVDDAYLLMGKAHFYKQEYTQASDIFRLLINDFKNQPVIFETQLWLARLSIETRENNNAAEILAVLINNTSFPKKLMPELYATYADFHLKRKDFIQSITFLEKALQVEKSKKKRTRYLYILAQLFEKTGNLKQASDYYAQVIKMNPIYEMAFNAHINRALAYEQGFGQAEEIESELNKMLHDDKNIEYQDQIYFALGNLAAKEGDNTKALEYYIKSIEANKGNDQQKTRSYLTIADLYYAIPDYTNAQAYYDSLVTYIDADYPGYNTLYTKSKSLTRLVNEINTVKLADSVLLLAKLPREVLYERIDAIIESERQQEELARIKKEEENLDQQFGTEMVRQNTSSRLQTKTEGTSWYFYNDAAKSIGYQEFKLKWGNRRLEDHWQRASKALVNFLPTSEEEDEVESSGGKTAEPVYNKMAREYYLINIPFTDSAVNDAHVRTELALFNMGLIYKNDLKDYNRSSEAFKELIKRFPSSTYLLTAYYNLYSIAKEQNNVALIDYYKNIIATQFPESMYAKILTNPDYFKELEKEEQIVRQYYEQTYALYKSEQYAEVISRTDFALVTYLENELIPLFDYLGTLARGKTSDPQVFRENLAGIIATYPGTEIEEDAKNLMAYMDIEHPEMKEAEEIKISQALYRPTSESPHLFAFVLNKSINTNQLIFNIINFNLDQYDDLNLIVEVLNLNPAQNLVLVKTFNNQQQVMQYLNAISQAEEIHKDLPEWTKVTMAISLQNLAILVEDRSVERYLKFFTENYQ